MIHDNEWTLGKEGAPMPEQDDEAVVQRLFRENGESMTTFNLAKAGYWKAVSFAVCSLSLAVSALIVVVAVHWR